MSDKITPIKSEEKPKVETLETLGQRLGQHFFEIGRLYYIFAVQSEPHITIAKELNEKAKALEDAHKKVETKKGENNADTPKNNG